MKTVGYSCFSVPHFHGSWIDKEHLLKLLEIQFLAGNRASLSWGIIKPLTEYSCIEIQQFASQDKEQGHVKPCNLFEI